MNLVLFTVIGMKIWLRKPLKSTRSEASARVTYIPGLPNTKIFSFPPTSASYPVKVRASTYS